MICAPLFLTDPEYMFLTSGFSLPNSKTGSDDVLYVQEHCSSYGNHEDRINGRALCTKVCARRHTLRKRLITSCSSKMSLMAAPMGGCAELRSRIEIISLYPNRHFLDIFSSLPDDRWSKRFWFFRGIPAVRSGLGWPVPQPNLFLRGPGGAANFLRAIRAVVSASVNVFLGLLVPLPWHLALVVASVRSRKPTFIVSEGFKKPLQHGKKFLTSLCNRPNVSMLGCGEGSCDDFRAIGLDQWVFRRFGFVEQRDISPLPAEPEGELHILLAGQLISRKNFVSVLHQLASISVPFPVVVDVAGEGPERSALIQASKLLPERIVLRLHGLCDEVRLNELFSRAAIFVLPSLYDGWGVVLNHAIASHLPVIVSSNVRAGKGHLVIPGENGFIFDNNADLGASLRLLIADGKLRARMRAGSSRVALIWNFQSMAARLQKLLCGQEVEQIGGPLDRLHPDSRGWWKHWDR